MPSNYKKLGPYIREVKERNTDLHVTTLLGVSIQKVFMPSIANTVGTDMSTYKIVRKNQFAYGPVTSRNGDKISVALLQDHEEAIISQAYIPFEVIDHNDLDPEYLMMWFRRPEFDRYARFKSHGSARETFDWDEMCDTELPIPHIDVQRAMVKEYNTITDRIALNEQLNQKLEETAQALYCHWFENFEFPYDFEKGEPSLKGQPYKSSGGEMEWCEELEKEIPKGWQSDSFTNIIDLGSGGTPRTSVESFWAGEIPFFTPKDVEKSYYTTETIKSISSNGLNNCNSKLYPANTVFVTARGTVGAISLAGVPMAMNQSCYAITGIKGYRQFYIHQLTLHVLKQLKEEAIGAVFNALGTKDFDGTKVLIPNLTVGMLFDTVVVYIYEAIRSKTSQQTSLKKMREVLLSKMSTAGTGVAGGVRVG